ncbi:hypothetical protein DKX38_002372 [Salix brachista]|uniref:AAA+ ATPase domain-containing protein n=1 Tax=Salix brachista TaxID=2182728 RepID=A0A5N5NN42_9ROSI|nr:hypothetical protein DKX38_002372 [Salix brachista]
MAEVIALMDIDEEENQNHLSKPNKGENVVVPATTPTSKATPWVEKYRPQSLADVAAHRDIVDTSYYLLSYSLYRCQFCMLANNYEFVDRLTSENRLPHLLLYGPPGTGKTSTILAVARKLYGAQYRNMILELNASDDRGIDVVRKQIQDFASTQSFTFGVTAIIEVGFEWLTTWLNDKLSLELITKESYVYSAKASVKLVLLDEADAMTKDAQFALRRVIEKYTKSTRFALICNHVNKIIPALQSRCTRFRFAPLEPMHVGERLKHVIEAEGLDVPESGLEALKRLSNGDMRKALNILQSTHMASQQITEETVYLCTGNPLPQDVQQITHWLLNESFAESYKRISEIKTRKGLALVDIVREVTMFVFKIKMQSDIRVPLINDLADIEYRLSFGCNDKLQLGSLIASFTRTRSALVAAAN